MTGQELRAIRKRLGWTQQQLAEATGVALNPVWRWEAGQMGIKESAARLIALIAAAERKRGGGRR